MTDRRCSVIPLWQWSRASSAQSLRITPTQGIQNGHEPPAPALPDSLPIFLSPYPPTPTLNPSPHNTPRTPRQTRAALITSTSPLESKGSWCGRKSGASRHSQRVSHLRPQKREEDAPEDPHMIAHVLQVLLFEVVVTQIFGVWESHTCRDLL